MFTHTNTLMIGKLEWNMITWERFLQSVDWTQLKRVCKYFQIKKIVEYHDLYVQSDTLLLQLWTKYLRQTLVFMWNSTLREKFNFYFWGGFC